MNIHIREAEAGDISAITSLTNQLGYTIDEKAMGENFDYIQREKDGIIYTAVVESNTVGWLHVAKRISLESGSFYEILGLVVDASCRNKGIGKKLVEQAIQWSRKEGAATLRVRSNLVRKQAHQFYTRQGFEQKKEQKVFEIKL